VGQRKEKMDKSKTKKKTTTKATEVTHSSLDSEDELTRAQPLSKDSSTSSSGKSSHQSSQESEELVDLRKKLEEKDGIIADLKDMIKELKEVVSLLKSTAKSSESHVSHDQRKILEEKKFDRGQAPSGATRGNAKKVSFAEILKEEKVNPSFEIEEITDSKWIGNQLKYLVSLKDGRDLWLSCKEFQADSIIKTFHEENPGAPAPNDFEENNQWRSVVRKEKNVGKKLAAKKELSPQDIDFIAFGLTKAKESSKEFKKVHLRIENKRILRNCTYKQKQTIIMKVLQSYGLSGGVSRISFIGSSVLEVYLLAESEAKFKTGMLRNDWKFIDNFDYYAPTAFNDTPASEEKEKSCLNALVQRLAFLSAGTKLINLKECILAGLHEDTKAEVLKREQEIKESREGHRTAYVLPSQ